jgi:hypothetical protein
LSAVQRWNIWSGWKFDHSIALLQASCSKITVLLNSVSENVILPIFNVSDIIPYMQVCWHAILFPECWLEDTKLNEEWNIIVHPW